MKFKKLFFPFLFFFVLSCRPTPKPPIPPVPAPPADTVSNNYTLIQAGELPELMVPGSRLMPLISAHRGGRNIKGYPENSIEVFEYTLQSTPAMLECDVNLSKDGILLIMHDNSLDRTTTGTGPVMERDWSYIQSLQLKDDFGTVTEFKVPLLEEALKWAKGKAILSLDVKRGVPFEKVIEQVEAAQMEDYVVIITYNIPDAELVHRLNPRLMISVSARNQEEWQRLQNSQIPKDRMVAFTGTVLSPKALFDSLHQYDIPTILGTLGNLDRQAAAQGDKVTYTRFLDLGVDILATDRPVEAGVITAGYGK